MVEDEAPAANTRRMMSMQAGRGLGGIGSPTNRSMERMAAGSFRSRRGTSSTMLNPRARESSAGTHTEDHPSSASNTNNNRGRSRNESLERGKLNSTDSKQDANSLSLASATAAAAATAGLSYRYSEREVVHGWALVRVGLFNKPQRLFLRLRNGGLLSAHTSADEGAPSTWEVSVAGGRATINTTGRRSAVTVRTAAGVATVIAPGTPEEASRWAEALQRSTGLVFGELYSQEHEIGAGFYATVYMARDERTREAVAVKLMRKKLPTETETARIVHVIEREVAIVRALPDHHHVVRTLDVFETERDARIVMEYMSGGSLYERVRQKGRLPEERAKWCMAQIVAAVAHLHKHRIVHRDVKSENVLLDDSGNLCKLADFGLSRELPRVPRRPRGQDAKPPKHVQAASLRDKREGSKEQIRSDQATTENGSVEPAPVEDQSGAEAGNARGDESYLKRADSSGRVFANGKGGGGGELDQPQMVPSGTAAVCADRRDEKGGADRDEDSEEDEDDEDDAMAEFKLESLTGTPEYIAPEIVERRSYGLKVDVWAVGVLAYVLLSGQYPYHGKTPKETMQQILAGGRLSFPTTSWNGVSKEAVEFVRAVLVHDASQRPRAKDLLKHPWLAPASTALDLASASHKNATNGGNDARVDEVMQTRSKSKKLVSATSCDSVIVSGVTAEGSGAETTVTAAAVGTVMHTVSAPTTPTRKRRAAERRKRQIGVGGDVGEGNAKRSADEENEKDRSALLSASRRHLRIDDVLRDAGANGTNNAAEQLDADTFEVGVEQLKVDMSAGGASAPSSARNRIERSASSTSHESPETKPDGKASHEAGSQRVADPDAAVDDSIDSKANSGATSFSRGGSGGAGGGGVRKFARRLSLQMFAQGEVVTDETGSGAGATKSSTRQSSGGNSAGNNARSRSSSLRKFSLGPRQNSSADGSAVRSKLSRKGSRTDSLAPSATENRSGSSGANSARARGRATSLTTMLDLSKKSGTGSAAAPTIAEDVFGEGGGGSGSGGRTATGLFGQKRRSKTAAGAREQPLPVPISSAKRANEQENEPNGGPAGTGIVGSARSKTTSGSAFAAMTRSTRRTSTAAGAPSDARQGDDGEELLPGPRSMTGGITMARTITQAIRDGERQPRVSRSRSYGKEGPPR